MRSILQLLVIIYKCVSSHQSNDLPKELPSAAGDPNSAVFLDLNTGRRSYDVTRLYDDLGRIPKGFLSDSCYEDLQLLYDANYRRNSRGDEELTDFEAAVFLPALDAADRIGHGIAYGEGLFGGNFKGCRVGGNIASYSINPMIATNQDRLACMARLMGMNLLIMGVCLPSTCSSIELIDVMRPPSGSPSIIQNPICSLVRINDDIPEKDDAYLIVSTIVKILVALCMVSGILDYFTVGENSLETISIKSITQCFSIHRNIQSLFRITTEHHEDSIRALGAIKVISITWILFGHGSSYFYRNGNTKAMHEFLHSSLSGQIILSSFFAVDTFFFISGLLLTYIWLKFHRVDGMTSTARGSIMFYIHRLARLTPLYYFVLLYYTFIFLPNRLDVPYIMNDRFKEDLCRVHLWQSLAYLTNLLPADDQCLSFTWYLSVDIQLFALSPFLLILLATKPRKGNAHCVMACFTGIAASTAYNFYLVYKHNLPAKIAMLQRQMNGNSDMVTEMYNSPFIRAQLIDSTLWLLSFASLVLIYFNFSLYSHTDTIPIHLSAKFSSFARIFWGLALFWIIFSTHNGGGGPIRSLLSWSGWSIPSRLTYSTYLLHVITIKWLFDQNTLAPRFVGFLYESITLGIPSIVLSFSTAAIAHLIVEKPFANLYALIIRTNLSQAQKTEKTS